MVTNRNKMYFDFQRTFANFPIISIQEIAKSFLHFDKKALVNWQNKGYIQRIRNGYYVFSTTVKSEEFLFFTANKIYSPSYISFESALAYYGIIPEGVFLQTSATTLKTNYFKTSMGDFSYKKIKNSLFFGYHLVQKNELTYKIATKEKAILDTLYLSENISTLEDFEALRWNKEILKTLNFKQIQEYLTIIQSKALEKRIQLLISYIHA